MGDGRRLFGKPFGLRRRVYFCFLFCVCPVQLAWLLYVRLPQNVFKVALCHTPSHHVEDLPLSRNVLQGQPLSPFPLSFTSILALPIQSRLLHRLIEEAASWRFCPPSRSLSQGQSWTGALHTVALSPWYKSYLDTYGQAVDVEMRLPPSLIIAFWSDSFVALPSSWHTLFFSLRSCKPVSRALVGSIVRYSCSSWLGPKAWSNQDTGWPSMVCDAGDTHQCMSGLPLVS